MYGKKVVVRYDPPPTHTENLRGGGVSSPHSIIKSWQLYEESLSDPNLETADIKTGLGQRISD